MVYIFYAEGFEEIEAIAPTDILKRAEVQVVTVGIGGKIITGAHGIKVECDITEKEAMMTEDLEGVILPGGGLGTENLDKNGTVDKFLKYASEKGLLTAAICAAPSVLGKRGYLQGRQAVCYDGFEKYLLGATVTDKKVEVDGNYVTACGAGAACEFGLELVKYLKGEDVKNQLYKAMKF